MIAASTVVAIGSIRATPLLTRGSEGMLETLSAIDSAYASLVGRYCPALPAGPCRYRHRLGQGSGQAIIDDHDRFQLRQLGIGLDPRSTRVGRRHHADRQTWRKHPALTRSDDPVADFDRVRRIGVEQAGALGIIAGEHG